MIILSFPRSGRNWLVLQLVYYAIPEAVKLHPLNAIQMLSKACEVLGVDITLTHGDYHLAGNPKGCHADIILTRDFGDIKKSFKKLWGDANIDEDRYNKMLSDNPHAWRFDYADRLADPVKTFEQFLEKIGALVGDVQTAVWAASINSLKKFDRLSYIAGLSFSDK
jgi:hypothetical protein